MQEIVENVEKSESKTFSFSCLTWSLVGMSDNFQAICLLDPGCPIVKFLELFIQAFLKLWADKLPRVSGLQFACATCQGLVINGMALYAILDEARLAKSLHPTRQNWEGLWMVVKLQGTRQKDMRPTGPQDSIGISQVLDLDPLCSLKVLAFPCGIWGIGFFLQLAMQRLIQTPAPPRKRK